jgi:protein-disulfide isomerase
MEKRKTRILATAGVAIALLVIGMLYELSQWSSPIHLSSARYPTLGEEQAKVELILFEDFRCDHCRTFCQEIFPQIKSRYIDSGKVRYTVVPLAFIKGSKPIANAALAVFKHSPDRFFAYLEAIFQHDRKDELMGAEQLIELAREVGGIHLASLKKSIEKGLYYNDLVKNTRLARKMMGKYFGAPRLFVNGTLVPTSSFRSIQGAIDNILEKEG